jgi:hypothetical protein
MLHAPSPQMLRPKKAASADLQWEPVPNQWLHEQVPASWQMESWAVLPCTTISRRVLPCGLTSPQG